MLVKGIKVISKSLVETDLIGQVTNALTEAKGVNNCKETAISSTQAFWKKKRGYILTDEEARRVNESVTEYFRILKRLAIRIGPQQDDSGYRSNIKYDIGTCSFFTFVILWIIVVFQKCSLDEG